MLIIPAIDIKNGCVVRLEQGARNEKTYSRNPLKTAKHWQKQGARLIHVVDLDGATSGIPKNLDIVQAIARNIDIPLQFGGGVRKISTIKTLLEAGVKRVVLGTKAFEDKVFLKKAFKEFGKKVIVSLDVKSGQVATHGWRSSYSKIDAYAFAGALKDIGFKELIYTDTLKDGMLSGPNVKGIKELLKKGGMKVIASGGISSLDDIHKLKELENQGLVGIIIGKALYEGKFTLLQAQKMA